MSTSLSCVGLFLQILNDLFSYPQQTSLGASLPLHRYAQPDYTSSTANPFKPSIVLESFKLQKPKQSKERITATVPRAIAERQKQYQQQTLAERVCVPSPCPPVRVQSQCTAGGFKQPYTFSVSMWPMGSSSSVETLTTSVCWWLDGRDPSRSQRCVERDHQLDLCIET